jgi:hypothetical protein
VTEGTVAISITSSTSTYNPITDSYSLSTYNTTGIVLDYHKAFTRTAQADFKVQAGDISLVVPKAAVLASQGLELTILAGSKFAGHWRTLSFVDEHDSWNLHLRRR